jgi:cytochrome c5
MSIRIPSVTSTVLVAFLSVGCSDAAKTTEPAADAKPADAKPADAKPADAPAGDAKPADGAVAAAAAADPVAEAKTIFDTRCVTCHGATGLGDGAAAAALNPKPRTYADKAWQDSVKDEDLAKAIIEGGAAIGKSPLMPPNPDLKDKPAVVSEIVKIIRSFAPAS